MNTRILSAQSLPAAPAAERPELAALATATLRAALTKMHLIRKFEELIHAELITGIPKMDMHIVGELRKFNRNFVRYH